MANEQFRNAPGKEIFPKQPQDQVEKSLRQQPTTNGNGGGTPPVSDKKPPTTVGKNKPWQFSQDTNGNQRSG